MRVANLFMNMHNETLDLKEPCEHDIHSSG